MCSPALRLCLCAGLVGVSRGQIKILGPDTLLQVPDLVNSSGYLLGSTATFGAPKHGDRVMGHLVYSKTKGQNHCTTEDYDLAQSKSLRRGHQLPNIVLVRAGVCSILTQVLVAQSKDAQAVIIVDDEAPDFIAEQIHHEILSGDDVHQQVTIPSIKISKHIGLQLIGAAALGAVVVELSWDKVQGNVTTADFWMSSGSREAAEFLARFQDSAEVMKENLEFIPHFHIFSLPAILGSANICVSSVDGCESCTPAPGRFCAPDPDGPGPITGADVVNEDLRRLCIMNATAEVQETTGTQFSQALWDYTELFSKACTLDVTNKTTNETRFGHPCSMLVMQKVGIPVDQVNACTSQSFAQLLEEQVRGVAWSPQALRLNGWRYTDQLDPKLVVKAVCSSFLTQPKACKDLLDTASMSVKAVVKRAQGHGLGAVLAIAGIVVATLSLGISAYKKHVTKTMRKALREEVMLEAQSQISEYVSMQESTGEKHLSKA